MTTTSSIEGTGRRVGLERADVVKCALELVEADGADALTMRRLAAELDVTTTTIYWHIGSRDELVTAVIRLQSQRQADRPVRGSSPRERVMDAARRVWESALEHRELTSLAHRTGTTSLLELPLELSLVRELEAAGIRGNAAAASLRSILTCVGGFLVLALRDDSAIPSEHRSQALWADIVDEGIDASTVEALSRPTDLGALFEKTVRAVVDQHLPE